jgi:hypothetical protein
MRVLILIILILPLLLSAQTGNKARYDSLFQKLKKDSAFIYRKTIARPYLKAENRYSYILKKPVNFAGFLAGVNLYERHIICAGYYFLRNPSNKVFAIDNENNQQLLKLAYVDFAYQYIIFNSRYYQLNAPLEVGYGNYSAKISHLASMDTTQLSGNFIPYGGGLQLIIKPLPWAGFSACGGYREVKKDAIRVSFNGWYYSFGVWVDARLIFRNTRYYFRKKQFRKETSGL